MALIIIILSLLYLLAAFYSKKSIIYVFKLVTSPPVALYQMPLR